MESDAIASQPMESDPIASRTDPVQQKGPSKTEGPSCDLAELQQPNLGNRATTTSDEAQRGQASSHERVG